ncbi:hypothetical protein LCGC14_1767530 [marine sediment metagenome]|uniref:Uncharacterized protein n=1 Tax=marine sediment metagenome TaxID=412755 RepID=A0A0F9JE19_9ZZZZ
MTRRCHHVWARKPNYTDRICMRCGEIKAMSEPIPPKARNWTPGYNVGRVTATRKSGCGCIITARGDTTLAEAQTFHFRQRRSCFKKATLFLEKERLLIEIAENEARIRAEIVGPVYAPSSVIEVDGEQRRIVRAEV